MHVSSLLASLQNNYNYVLTAFSNSCKRLDNCLYNFSGLNQCIPNENDVCACEVHVSLSANQKFPHSGDCGGSVPTWLKLYGH